MYIHLSNHMRVLRSYVSARLACEFTTDDAPFDDLGQVSRRRIRRRGGEFFESRDALCQTEAGLASLDEGRAFG